ncbi:MAG: hypothetical protein ACERKY_13075, partial [Anaerolineales bacterium]
RMGIWSRMPRRSSVVLEELLGSGWVTTGSYNKLDTSASGWIMKLGMMRKGDCIVALGEFRGTISG